MTQKICETIGKYGCYYLCILKLFGNVNDAIALYEKFTKTKLPNGKPVMDETCYLNDPGFMASKLTGKKWTIRHETADYICKPDEVEILRYENGTQSHFVLPKWDPLDKSVTRTKGKLVSKRVLKQG